MDYYTLGANPLFFGNRSGFDLKIGRNLFVRRHARLELRRPCKILLTFAFFGNSHVFYWIPAHIYIQQQLSGI